MNGSRPPYGPDSAVPDFDQHDWEESSVHKNRRGEPEIVNFICRRCGYWDPVLIVPGKRPEPKPVREVPGQVGAPRCAEFLVKKILDL